MMDFTQHGLFRILVGAAGVVLFGLFLLWQFLAGVASVILLILPGVLFAGIISAPVANVLVHESWFRRLERKDGNGKESTP